LPAASPPLQLLSSDRKVDRPEVTLPPRKRLNIVHCPRYEAGESSVAAVARPIEGRRSDYGFVDSVEAEIRRRRAEDIRYGIRDTWIDPRDVAEEEALTTLEGEARCSREAWAHSIGLSSAVHFKLQGYMTHTWVQDQRIDPQVTLIATLTTQLSSLQGHLATTLGEIRALQAREQARAASRRYRSFVCHTSGTGVGRTERVTRECTYHDFMKCQPLYFKGTEGVVELTQWFERMETVFRISNSLAENQELALLCVRTCPEESDRVERYIGGFPDSIHEGVATSKPKTIQEATEMATRLMDKKIRTYAKRQAANKRKFEDTSRNNQGR
nr:hypothetical protein [Tanacetum cinerariifolium]